MSVVLVEDDFASMRRVKIARRKKVHRQPQLVGVKAVPPRDGTRQVVFGGQEIRKAELLSYRERMYAYNQRSFRQEVEENRRREQERRERVI